MKITWVWQRSQLLISDELQICGLDIFQLVFSSCMQLLQFLPFWKDTFPRKLFFWNSLFLHFFWNPLFLENFWAFSSVAARIIRVNGGKLLMISPTLPLMSKYYGWDPSRVTLHTLLKTKTYPQEIWSMWTWTKHDRGEPYKRRWMGRKLFGDLHLRAKGKGS